MCTFGNEHLSEKVPRGNGTTCRLTDVKLKKGAKSLRWKNYYGKKFGQYEPMTSNIYFPAP
jgi:hypothetical protein